MTRQSVSGFVLLAVLSAGASSACYAQVKKACDLLTKADVEAGLGVVLAGEPFSPRSGGKVMEGHCTFTNGTILSVDVSYTPAANPAAVEQWLKGLDENSVKDDPVTIPGIGDAAFGWQIKARGADTSLITSSSLWVFKAGTMTLTLSGDSPLEQLKALALKALGGSGNTGYVYGTRAPLKKPVLASLGPKPSPLDQLKRDLTAKAEAGDANAALVLGNLYQVGAAVADGTIRPDYLAAAYWYDQAAGKGVADGAYRLGLLYRDGLGVTADAFRARELLKQAGLAGHVRAMSVLAYTYLDVKNRNGETRASVWADKAAKTGNPEGWFIQGYIASHTDRPSALNDAMYREALEDYKKAADGGHCAAMLSIGELYFTGKGVKQDAKQSQDWFAKAEACDGKDLESLRQKAKEYREKAAKGDLPVVIPTVVRSVMPVSAEIGVKGSGGLSNFQQQVRDALAATALVAGWAILTGGLGGASVPDPTGHTRDGRFCYRMAIGCDYP